MAVTYRSEIDGLRALAIVPVVLFHARIPGVEGGYVGVDVFFVISGFLITNLILADISRQQFSYLDFWERRTRRLFPPIIVVTAATFAVGSYFLMPTDLKYVGQSAVAVATFTSNILFWLKSDYFAAPAESVPLLHLWSLAVEEQFYLLFPAALLLVSRWGARGRTALIALTGILSFYLSVRWSYSDAASAYYLLPSRAWELMLGSSLASFSQRHHSPSWKPLVADATIIVGSALVLFAIINYEKSTPFPGIAALLPCAGTALLLWVGAPPGSRLAGLFKNDLAVFFGRLSYSLYLWHWPVLVLWKTWRRQPLELLPIHERVALILVCVALAWLSYKFIEAPIRERRICSSRRSLFTTVMACMLLISIVGVGAHLTSGFPDRLPEAVLKVVEGADDWTAEQFACGDLEPDVKPCRIGVVDADPTFLVWGDSHAQALFEVIHNAARKEGLAGYHGSRGACPPIPGYQPLRTGFFAACPAFNRMMLEEIDQRRPQLVILVGRWSGYGLASDGLRLDSSTDQLVSGQSREELAILLADNVNRLRARGSKIALVDEPPYPNQLNPGELGIAVWRQKYSLEKVGITLDEYLTRNQFWTDLRQKAPFLNTLQIKQSDALCSDNWCPAAINGQLVYRDGNHLSNYGARELEPAFRKLLRDSVCQIGDCPVSSSARRPGSSGILTQH